MLRKMGALATSLIVLTTFALSQGTLTGWRVVTPVGISARWTRSRDKLVINFAKSGNERRLLLLETTSPDIAKAKSVLLRFKLKLVKGKPPKLAVLAYRASNEVWFKVSPLLALTDEEIEWQLPLTGLRPAAFSVASGEPDLTKIRRLQVGLALDGVCFGVWEIREIALLTKPFRPSRPLVIPISTEIPLSLNRDPAAKARTSIAKEGISGGWCWKTEFTIPGGRHMYVLPSIHMPDMDLTGYSELRITYRAKLPVGIKALLIILVENDGSHYYNDRIAVPTDEWRTLTIPISEFRLGSWSQDENGKLDRDKIESIVVGMHGTTSEQEGHGTILVTSIAFVP